MRVLANFWMPLNVDLIDTNTGLDWISLSGSFNVKVYAEKANHIPGFIFGEVRAKATYQDSSQRIVKIGQDVDIEAQSFSAAARELANFIADVLASEDSNRRYSILTDAIYGYAVEAFESGETVIG